MTQAVHGRIGVFHKDEPHKSPLSYLSWYLEVKCIHRCLLDQHSLIGTLNNRGHSWRGGHVHEKPVAVGTLQLGHNGSSGQKSTICQARAMQSNQDIRVHNTRHYLLGS